MNLMAVLEETFPFTPSTSVPSTTVLVTLGKRLSSASIVSESVPVWSTVTSPKPVSSTAVKPLTLRDSLSTLPEPAVPQAPSRTATANAVPET